MILHSVDDSPYAPPGRRSAKGRWSGSMRKIARIVPDAPSITTWQFICSCSVGCATIAGPAPDQPRAPMLCARRLVHKGFRFLTITLSDICERIGTAFQMRLNCILTVDIDLHHASHLRKFQADLLGTPANRFNAPVVCAIVLRRVGAMGHGTSWLPAGPASPFRHFRRTDCLA